MNYPALDIVEGKMQWLNETIGNQFEKDRVVRAKLKEIKKYNRLSIKTKLKTLYDVIGTSLNALALNLSVIYCDVLSP